ncbi:glycerophosphodiester phosphodiesterase domain-containing protein 4 isoform X2 [Cyanistes caeruleus]|uniref:glycerophosphodiester phosphodiesterase domain-containing protein 4 isoform X2 n=1 Tax=Cyanistes caeruleus TaxID=156563 RepID=UPI000CDAF98A|nr:glycerophosphodiester phosphodiesterase domain-containing protein 4 isoform X2 [Cyanistes caeruleus]
MEASPTSLKRLRFGKLKVVRRRLLQRYEHQPFISCLAGFYSCRWKRYQRERTEPGKCCCNMRECMFFPLLVAAFCFSLVFLYTWGEGKNDYNSFDWYNYGNLGFWFLWSLVILIVAAVLFAYISLLLVLAMCLLAEGQQLYLHWSHKIGTFLVLGFSISALFALSILWRDHQKTVRLSFQVTAPYLHIGAIAIMVLLAWPVALHAIRADKKVTQVIIVGPYLAILLFLFLIPLGMYSPCIREMGTLGPKPALIGHRGAPMLAPENTEMSFLKTIEHGGDGLETDVAISYDGVPFLMHDDTLRRTTNIQEVYPNDTDKAASSFSWDALQKLNAGTWFLKVLWLHNGVRSFVQSVAPGFQHTMGRKAPIEDLIKHNIVKLNLVYTDMSSEDIRKYAEANITTNFYVVNEPWLYSLAWCSGAHSVTTNAVHLLKDLSQPLFLMTPQQYNIMWILTDLTSAFLISLIFALHWWREKNFSCCAQDSNPMIESGGTYNKFKTELSDMPAVLA